MRLFIAINLPERTKNLLADKVSILQREIRENLKWVEKNNWHLTLKFLGETKENQIKMIKKTISTLADKWQQAPLQFRGIAAFPHLNNPRVIFIGTEEGRDLVTGIQADLEAEIVKCGFQAENRPYHPHLTLARSRRNTDMKKVARKLKRYTDPNFINIYMQVEKISLMKSELHPEGPVYEELFSVYLQE